MVTIRLPEDLKERIDVARGDVPRERWVRRTLEQALPSGRGSAKQSVGDAPPVRTASARAPDAVDLSEKIKELEPAEGVGNPVGSNIVGRRTGATNVRAMGEGTPLPKIAPRRQPR